MDMRDSSLIGLSPPQVLARTAKIAELSPQVSARLSIRRPDLKSNPAQAGFFRL